LKEGSKIAKMKSGILILSFAATLLFPFLSIAQTPDQNIINQQDWITRQQQNKIEEDRRLREQETIRKERTRKKKEAEEEGKKQTPISKKTAECFPIKSIALIDANSVSKRQQKKLTSPFIGKCVEAKTLGEIITAIQTYYNDQGYVTARVNVPKQNIQSGNLELKILEGKIDEVIVGDNHFTDKMQEFTAFGFMEDDTLNLEDINQGLYQMNRLPSNNATMKIEPAINEGEAKVYIANQKKFPARATVGYDNLGNDFTGIHRTNFSGGIDNLLSLNDAINLSYSTNLNDDSQTKDIKSFTSGISIPFGYNTVSYDYSRSEFRGTQAGTNGPIRLTGFSERNNATIDRVLLNKGNFRLSTNASLTTKSSASYLNQAKIETSQRKLTIGSIGFTISDYFKNGVNLYLKPSYYKGLKLLNAKQDGTNLTGDTPKAQFDYFKLYASVSKRFTIPKTEIPFMLSTEMDSQYSKQTLFGTEQFSVGGYYSVRGFRENYINGDSGYYFRNKANFNIGSLAAHFAKNSEGFFAKNLVHLNKFSVEPFYDYGYVKNKYVSNGADGRLAGAGLKTIFSSRYFNASLTYSWATDHSRLITSTAKENKLIYFEVSASCC
jgi:hemolysin activation/secretion protein